MSDNTTILKTGRLQTQLRICSTEINKIKTKYNVKSAPELKKKIESGTVEEHPAWEELIVLENFEERLVNIQKELTTLHLFPQKPIKKMRGFVKDGNTKKIRDEEERF